jgi:hypothetical protein
MDTLSKSWASSDRLISKYTTTEKHISTGKPKASKLLKSLSTRPHEFSQTGSKIGIPNVSKSWKSSSTRIKIAVTHEEASTGKSQVSKLSKLSSAQSKISIAHEEVGI